MNGTFKGDKTIATPAEAVAMADKFTKEQDDYLFTYERKRANRIIALQCASNLTANPYDTLRNAVLYEKYLEYGE